MDSFVGSGKFDALIDTVTGSPCTVDPLAGEETISDGEGGIGGVGGVGGVGSELVAQPTSATKERVRQRNRDRIYFLSSTR
jgi:hypothetical protein